MLAEADVELILDQVRRLESAQAWMADTTALPRSDALTSLTMTLSEMGILSTAPDPGFALWEQTQAMGLRLSLEILRLLGRQSAGAAYLCHRQALSSWLLRRLGRAHGDSSTAVVLLSQGHYGLAREALPGWLQHCPQAELEGWLNPPAAPRFFQASTDWQALLLPVWRDRAIQWAVLPRCALSTREEPQSPGFDELASYAVQTGSVEAESGLSGSASRALYRDLLMLEALGLLAIACGSLERAHDLAWAYARERRQGGRRIIDHPAVSLMLADISLALKACRQQLASFEQDLTALDLADIFGARATLHPQLCHAADQAIQIHGGLGYMRDYGVEKVWREQQQLRTLAGTSLELRLFVAHWQRLR